VQDKSGSWEMYKIKVAVGKCARWKLQWENVQDESGSGKMCKMKVAVGKCAR
jgi:hypothetical protein